MNVQNIKRGSRLKRKSLVVVFATVICLLLVSPFIFVIDISGDGIGVNSAQAFNFSKSLSKIAGKADFETGPVSLTTIIGRIIYSVLSLLGVVFLIIVIIGGYRWMMSEGNEEIINRAKQSIKNAIIGVVIVLSAYAITYYVLNELL